MGGYLKKDDEMDKIKELSVFSDEELKAEIQRRKYENKKNHMADDYKKLMNTAILKNHSIVTENEIIKIVQMNPNYENNLQKALTWALQHKSNRVLNIIIDSYLQYSSERCFKYMPSTINLDNAMLVVKINEMLGAYYINGFLDRLIENELSFLRMKQHGGKDYIYANNRAILTGYCKELHIENRRKINEILIHAAESSKYHKLFRKCILSQLRLLQSCGKVDDHTSDFQMALNFLRWSGARWKTCREDV